MLFIRIIIINFSFITITKRYTIIVFKSDKDFVWNLWKNLQVEKPDITSVVNSVVERFVFKISSLSLD